MKQMRIRAMVFVAGSISRPSYEGHVDLGYIEEDIQEQVWRKLQRSSFPEISKSDVTVRRVVFS